jgi:hypothetical protein
MNILQSHMLFVFLFGFILSSSAGSLLLNICFSFAPCRPNDSYLKLTPTNFDPNVYNYTIHIPDSYPFYTSAGLMFVNFYVGMNVSNGDDFNYEKRSIAKSVLHDAVGNQVLGASDLAYSSNEMLLISAQLWRPEDRVIMFDTDNTIITKLTVYQFTNGMVQQSDPYTLIFKRNE